MLYVVRKDVGLVALKKEWLRRGTHVQIILGCPRSTSCPTPTALLLRVDC